MEQILTIPQEKKYIANFFEKIFKPNETNDEFTGEKTTCTTINILNSKDFEDIDFEKISTEEGIKEIESTYEIKHLVDEIGQLPGAPHRPYSETAEGAVEALQEEARKSSEIHMYVSAKFNGKDNPKYAIEIYFYNQSHHREMKNLKCLLLSTEGIRHEILLSNAEIAHYSGSFEFEDSVTCSITEEEARMLTSLRTKLSVRFDNLIINGKVSYYIPGYDEEKQFDFINFAYVYFDCFSTDANFTLYSDEQIDEMYDCCVKMETAYNEDVKKKKEEEKSRQRKLDKEEKENHANKDLESKIAKDFNPYLFDNLEQLFTDPLQIDSIAALKDYCDKNGVTSKNYKWLSSIGEKYDKDVILSDVRCLRTKSQKSHRARKITGAILIVLSFAFFGGCCKLCSEDYVGWGFLCVFISVVLFLWGGVRFYNDKMVHYNDTTSKFIEDWEKHFGDNFKKKQQ